MLSDPRALPSLPSLDDADARLRALYRELADDPDRADEVAPELARLQEDRRRLALQVGLEALAWARNVDAGVPLVAAKPAAAEPEAVPAPPEAVDAFVVEVRTNGFQRIAEPVEPGPAALARLLRQVGSPRPLDTLVGAVEELDALDEVSREPDEQGWHRLPRPAQRLWVGMLAARARALKQSSLLSDEQRDRLRSVLLRFPAWTSSHNPGFVHGLAASHWPQTESWQNDGLELWAGLRAELDEDAPTSSPNARPVAPRPSASSRGNGDAAAVLREELPESWPGWTTVRDKRAAIAGGTPREDARIKLERAFALAELDWPEIANPRRVDGLVRRIESGTVDLVILIQNLINHSACDSLVDACKGAGVPFVLSQGYGVGGVRAAIEKYELGGSAGRRSLSHTEVPHDQR